MHQFPDIAGPVVMLEPRHGRIGDLLGLWSADKQGQKMLRQQRDVFRSRPKCRHVDGEDSQAMLQIQAKRLFLRALFQRLVRRGNDPYIDVSRLVIAHPLQFAALQKSQHLGLQRQGHLAYLIEKYRAPVRCLDTPGSRPHGAGKSTAGAQRALLRAAPRG